MTVEVELQLGPSCEGAAAHPTLATREGPARATLASVLSASAVLVRKTAAMAQPYAKFLEAIRRGCFEDDEGWLYRGDELPRLLRYRAGPGDLKTLVQHAGAGGLPAEQIVRGLLEWSEAVGFEDPEVGRELAEAALVVAREVPEDLRATARLALASWRRVLGDPLGSGELFGTVMSRSEGLSESRVHELSRRYSYLLADSGEPGGAVFSAWNAIRASTSCSVHERGLADLAMAYACVRAGRKEDALVWYHFGLPLLNPVDGFPDCFQAVVNMLHFASDLGAGTDLSEAVALGEQLWQCSPFGAESAPSVHLRWARQRLRLGTGKLGGHEASPWATLTGAPYCTLFT